MLVVVIDLVHNQNHLLGGAAQNVGHHHIEVGNAGRDLDHKQNHIGLVDSQHHLTTNLVFEDVVRSDRVTTRIDHRELTTVPIRATIVAVAGCSGSTIDDRLAHTDQTVEEGTFAHVGASYYCY